MTYSIINSLITGYNNIRVGPQKEIADDELLTLIKAARLAPSAYNSQIWRFLIIRDVKRIEQICKYISIEKKYNKLILALSAPFIIKHIRREQPFYAIDVPIAISHILLQALELGIKTDIHFIFGEMGITEMLNIPGKYKPVAILGLASYAD